MSKERIKTCLYCQKEFTLKPKAKNVKFCSVSCRGRFDYYKNNRKQWQRDYLQRKLLNKYSKDELIQCKICGGWFRQVGSHIVERHGITAREYRKEFGFDVKRGQLPDDYRQLKAEQVFEGGGVKNLKKGKKFRFKKGQEGVGVYKRSKQTQERLVKQGKMLAKKYKRNLK